MNDKDKINRLRACYGNRMDDVAKKILDSFASKTNWRSESLVHRIALETQLPERSVRAFLKEKLEEELQLGHYRKGAQGFKSRFIWNVGAGYSLIQIGLAAQGNSDILQGNAEELVAGADEDEGKVIEEKVKIGKDRYFRAEFPSDLTEKEFEHFVAHMKLIHFPESD